MFGRNAVPTKPIFRCYEAQRWIGGLMFAFGGLAGLGIFLTGGAGLVIGPLWGGPIALLGARMSRVGVFETPGYLLVRNRFATRRAPWDEIAIIEFRNRPVGVWMRVHGLVERRCGALCFESGDRMWLDATDMTRRRFFGTYQSHTDAEARAGVDQIRAVCQAHRAPV